jgi:hypothetical protein
MCEGVRVRVCRQVVPETMRQCQRPGVRQAGDVRDRVGADKRCQRHVKVPETML